MTQPATPNQQEGLLLPGLDGSNPLGFLAALGLFQVVDAALGAERTRMQWVPSRGTWVPSITGTQLDLTSLLNLMEENLPKQIDRHPVSVLGRLGNDDAIERAGLFLQLAHGLDASHRRDADWLAALASDFTPASANNQLQTARRDYYFGNLASVIAHTTRDHLNRAIFHPWDYTDPLDNQSLHLDPSEDRRHALQWNKPAGDPNRKNSGGMLGANRLAIEAIVWFTSLPQGDVLRTVGFTGRRSYNTRWTWPIWEVPLSVATARSTLMFAELQESTLSTDAIVRLRRRGIATAFRSARILVGKTPNFTPAQRIA